MTFIFYALFFLIGMLQELESLFKPQSVLDKQIEIERFNKAKKENPTLRAPGETLWLMLAQIMYFFLTFIGMMTSQWPVFIFLFAMGFIPKKWKPFIFLDALISVMLILFIIINKYHLQIDLTELIISQF